MPFNPRPLASACLGLFLCTGHASALTLPAILSDGMVIQRGQPVRLWGTATPGEHIAAELGGHSASTTVPPNGRWRLDLPAFEALSGDLLIRASSGETERIRSPLLGQVLLCGGQSNMAMPLKRTDGAALALQRLNKGAMLRLYRGISGRPVQRTEHWQDNGPRTASNFSAVCYMVGLRLAADMREPIGLIDVSLGNTPIEAWMPKAGFDTHGQRSFIEQPERHQQHLAFETIVRPITPYSVKGLLWYQGENNWRNASAYGDLLVTTMHAWRQAFEQPALPITYMQLPTFTNAPSSASWQRLRTEQARVEHQIGTAAMAGSDGIMEEQLHSSGKSEIASRLYRAFIRLTK